MKNTNPFLLLAQELTAQANKIEPGDYKGEDDLWYCGKCKTQKQGRYEGAWGVITPMQLCECKKKEYDLEKEAEKIAALEDTYSTFKNNNKKGLFALKKWFDKNNYDKSKKLIAERKRVLKELCFTEKKMMEWTFENDDLKNPSASLEMHNYVDNFQKFYQSGWGLCLFGGVGTGKSFYAACIVHDLIDRGKSAYMTNFAAIRNKIQEYPDGKQAFLDNLNSFDLMVIDDIGSEAETDYMQELVFSVIDTRARSGLPLIVTTNLTGEQMKNPQNSTMKERIYSRLLEMCYPVKIEGDDRRRARLKSSAKDIQKLLGII